MKASGLLFSTALLVASSAALATVNKPSATTSSPLSRVRMIRRNTLPQHVIVVVQENRSVDNLFQGFPGADTQNYGLNSKNQKVPLTQIALGASYDPSHAHGAFVTECNANLSGVCAMNGFDKEPCQNCPANTAYTYVNPNDITQYTMLASQYGLADHVLQPNEGPSQPGHVYLIAGQSGTIGTHWYMSENPLPRHSPPDDCLAQPNHTVLQIDMTTPYPGVEGNAVFPCIDPTPTILDELDQKHIEWRYYTSGLGSIWTAPYAVKHLYDNAADRARVIVPETNIISDIKKNALQPVSYVIPSGHNSDHPGKDNNGGPAWVASIVNAVGANSNYWPNTVIFVVWDDWGGWYDHYVPSHPSNPFGGTPDPYEYGFRVPLLAIGMTAKNAVDHTPRSSAAILHFIEDVFGLASLGTLDAQSDDLFGMFNFGSQYHAFKRIPTPGITPDTYLRRAPDTTPVDDD
ncbi:MAG: hypothetical protein JO060_02030 [Candidatus Eremiobacteraeota bacterium]|nr:hypothetical protein [Candidatus Eremiobacteraeota bacterium]MBV9646324.1 hypothetical protein [Candidatus Eremiobacteraeota bacterium]